MSRSRPPLLPLDLARGGPPRVMGVVNATPDSFSGDGLGRDVAGLLARAQRHAEDGAAILDLGGESTRPGSLPISAAEELDRVLPVLRQLVDCTTLPISIDTQKATVAARALEAGASVLNDVSGLQDPELAPVAAAHGAWLVVTHNGWTMGRASSDDVVGEVIDGLRRLVDRALAARVPETRLIVDPGLGFGKSPPESRELLRRTAELHQALAPLPLLLGPSRKGFIGDALGLPVDSRLEGTLACVAVGVFQGAELVRVHEVLPAVRAARMAWSLRQGQDAANRERLS